MSFELFIALRYLFARRKQAFISLISLISMIGVCVGVMALVIALALMTGLQGELRDKILSSQAHIYVWKTGGITDYAPEVAKLRQVPGVVGAAPTIFGKALITAGDSQAFISVKAIDPALEPAVTAIGDAMKEGSLDSLAHESEDEPPSILIGQDLARQLGVKVGDLVTLITPQGTLSPMGMLPRTRRARVGGVYSLGLYEFDSAQGFVSLPFGERLTGTTMVELIQLRVTDVYDAPRIADDIPKRLGTAYVAQDWSDLNQSLFSALGIEKMAISITIGLIVIVAALNIVASLILLVMEKSRDIAILKTMGTAPKRVMTIFMLQGLIIGVTGTVVGGLGGLALCHVLDKYRLIKIPADVYQVAYVPFVVLPRDFTIVIISAVVICFVATIYPSRRAAALDPVQALRFE
ncbi:MAG TPA: ABC transporter permease [Vicinamibacterales bacterium]|nr:ABC transporter permease [Vicinamibacterales bacterium]